MKQVILAKPDDAFSIVKRFRRVVEHEVLLEVQAGSLEDALAGAEAFVVPDDYVVGSKYRLVETTTVDVRVNPKPHKDGHFSPAWGQGPLSVVVFDGEDANYLCEKVVTIIEVPK